MRTSRALALTFALVAAGTLQLSACAAPPLPVPGPKIRSDAPETRALESRLLDPTTSSSGWTVLEPASAALTVLYTQAVPQRCDGDLSELIASPEPRMMATSVATRGDELLRQSAIEAVDDATYESIVDYYLACEGVLAPVMIDGIPATILNDLIGSGHGDDLDWFALDTAISSADVTQRSLWLFARLPGDILLTVTVVHPSDEASRLLEQALAHAS